MNSDEERIIMEFLKSDPEQFHSAATIGRRSSPKLFRKDPKWPVVHLERLFLQRLIECDPAGHYRYIDYEAKEKERKEASKKRMNRW